MFTFMLYKLLAGLNVVFRKMAESAKPVVEFTIDGETVKMISKVSFFNQVVDIKLDSEYHQSFEGNEMSVSIISR